MTYFLIPAYNESQNLKKLFSNIMATKAREKKIIIVDDGSTDDTFKIAKSYSKKYRVKVINYGVNKGPGYAFNYGFNYLLERLKPTDTVITMEADNTTDYKLIDLLNSKLKNHDVVIASPYMKGGKFVGIRLDRKLLSFISSILDQIFFKIPNVKTYTSFFRAYRGSILISTKKLYANKLITETGFSAVVEILIKLNYAGATFAEVPSIVDWRKKRGKSKMNVLNNIKRHAAIYKNFFQGKYSL